MSRIINSQGSPGTQRQRHRRTIAEALRRLMSKTTMDDEGRDLAALIVYSLREIDQNINRSAEAWEKRDYYLKADRFLHDWAWVAPTARLIAAALHDSQWARLSLLLAELAPRFQDIDVKTFTRKPRLWQGAYERLRAESR